uniref:2,3-bisphosphoglycerate-independent phosphoglycerate mutase n=1 Tax=Palmaria palmata TaxID=2822 RepID=A0A1C9CH73_PALPL|nr:phosphoglycerate mutase [Palmaria palmata]AOM67721.1 phosphoglycerate mutase [Palmaria palmata]
MKEHNIKPVILTILDGWGHSDSTKGNAIYAARTPNIDYLQARFPTTKLSASGLRVGLPEGQVGNSEVGHASIGSGRVIPQDLVRISASIQDKTFMKNKTINNLCYNVNQKNSKLHLIGLCSDGGVHSHISHLIALLNLIKTNQVANVCIHFIADGRDTKSNCATGFLETIINHIEKIGLGKICTVSGRYYAMDRDCRWTRTEAFYNILTSDIPNRSKEPFKFIAECYNNNISDEFIIPTRLSEGAIEDNDGILIFNFRPDRMRQIVQALKKDSFKGFKTKRLTSVEVATFTQYDSTLNIPLAFKPVVKTNFLGEIIAQNNLKQLRIAETEKYAHVTYFLNGGVEEPFSGEDRELIASPQVRTYDQTPEMSADQITSSLISAISKGIYSLIIVNYANPDMIGHTGNFESTVLAIEKVDQCISKIIQAVNIANGTLLVTADHGNAEHMIDSSEEPSKSHTTNLVPFIFMQSWNSLSSDTTDNCNISLREHGSLTDIAPTIIEVLNLPQPVEMTGKSLLGKVLPKVRF